MITVSFPKLLTKIPPALKGQKRALHKLCRIRFHNNPLNCSPVNREQKESQTIKDLDLVIWMYEEGFLLPTTTGCVRKKFYGA